MPTVGVIGAGISGLAAAHRLHRSGLSVRVLEASNRVGGVIRSERTEGFLVEHGPNSIRAGDAALEALIDELGLQEERVWANDAATTRYVVRDRVPVALPSSIGSFLSTDLFSTRAKLRLLAEPFVGRGTSDEESVAAFTERRLGPEVLQYAVAPFVGGVFAGAPDTLSLRHAFPRLAALEEDYGSLALGALGRALRSGSDDAAETPSGLFSFRSGLATLPTALAEALGDRILRNAPVTSLRSDDDQWEVTIAPSDGAPRSHRFDALVCTVPLHEFTSMEVGTPVDCAPLAEVSYPPLSVLALGFPKAALDHPLDGFGMLVPPTESDLDILGTIFSSTLFPGRAPQDRVLLTTFVGGARAPEQATATPDALRATVERDLDRLLGLNDATVFQRRIYWPHAIPQYTLGYGRVKDTLTTLEQTHPRLAFAGNYRQGVSVGDALTSGVDAADRLTDRLSHVNSAPH